MFDRNSGFDKRVSVNIVSENFGEAWQTSSDMLHQIFDDVILSHMLLHQ